MPRFSPARAARAGSGHLHSRRRGHRVQTLCAMPSPGRIGAVQPLELRRPEATCWPDCRAHRAPGDAAVASGLRARNVAGERRLSDREVDILRRWHEQGAPEGDAIDLPPLPTFASGWQLGQPDLVVTLRQPYQLRADGAEVWRNFVMPVSVQETRFVRSSGTPTGQPAGRPPRDHGGGPDAVLSTSRCPGRRGRLRGHGIGRCAAARGPSRRMDAGNGAVPGSRDRHGGSNQVDDPCFELHMMPSGKFESVQPQIGLHSANAPPTGPSMVLLRLDGDHQLDIPAGARDFVAADRFEVAGRSAGFLRCIPTRTSWLAPWKRTRRCPMDASNR